MSDDVHTILTHLGALWMLRLGCVVVNVECEMAGAGIADAVGFGIIKGRKRGILIETKTNHADFTRDHKKWHRRWRGPTRERGWSERYYLAPEGVLNKAEIPEGWGLLVTPPNDRPRIAKRVPYQAPDPAWWAHHFAIVAKMQTNYWARTMLGAEGFMPEIAVPGLPGELAQALAPLRHTDRTGPRQLEIRDFREDVMEL